MPIGSDVSLPLIFIPNVPAIGRLLRGRRQVVKKSGSRRRARSTMPGTVTRKVTGAGFLGGAPPAPLQGEIKEVLWAFINGAGPH